MIAQIHCIFDHPHSTQFIPYILIQYRYMDRHTKSFCRRPGLWEISVDIVPHCAAPSWVPLSLVATVCNY